MNDITTRIILSIIAIVMLVLTIKKGDKRTVLLTTLLTVGILITWAREPTIITIGFLMYIFTALLISIVNLKSKGLTRFKRITIVLTGAIAFFSNFFSIMHWPFAGIVRLSTIIPLGLYGFSLFKGMIKRKELGYLTILNADFLFRWLR